tara:strand:- start:99 stop:1109 length:1011 start_codon:yes stop_codon:yes gene_type:complete
MKIRNNKKRIFFKKIFAYLISGIFFSFPNVLNAETIQIFLKDGSKIIGILLKDKSNKSKLVINNDQLGLIEIPTSSLIENETNKSIISKFELIEESIEPKLNKQPSVTFSTRWQNSLQGGINSINSKSGGSLNYSISTNSRYRGIFNNYDVSTLYTYNESSSGSSKIVGNNRANIDFIKDLKINKKLSLYNSLHYRFNDSAFAGKQRIQKSLGFGYYSLKGKNYSFQTLIGPSIIYHSGGRFCDLVEYCGDLVQGWDLENIFKWDINRKLNLSISDVLSFANMGQLKGSNYLKTTLNFFPYTDRNLMLSLLYQNSHYEFTSTEPTKQFSFQVGKRF